MTQEEKAITPRTARKRQKAQERQDGSQSLRKLSNSQSSGPREKTRVHVWKTNIIPELEKNMGETLETEVTNEPDHVTTFKQRGRNQSNKSSRGLPLLEIKKQQEQSPSNTKFEGWGP